MRRGRGKDRRPWPAFRRSPKWSSRSLARAGALARGGARASAADARDRTPLRADGDDPTANVVAGARYLRKLLDRFGSVELALSAYNAGPTAVDRAGGAPTIATLRYVMNIEAGASSLPGC
jgi:hypothetical protein